MRNTIPEFISPVLSREGFRNNLTVLNSGKDGSYRFQTSMLIMFGP